MPRSAPLEDRFWAKIAPIVDPHDCWLWIGSRQSDGYGMLWVPELKTAKLAHRISYELHVAKIPGDYQIDHLCRVRNCVNPTHLDLVSPVENILRGRAGQFNRRKTHCPQGHPYIEGNLVPNWPGGGRRCLICHNVANLKRYYRRQARLRQARDVG